MKINKILLAGLLLLAGVFSLSGQTPIKDTTRIGILGNSFTYVFDTPGKLAAIARSQGHELDIHVNYKGGACFADHLTMPKSVDVVEEGDYQWFLLQDQSTYEAKYADDPVKFESVMKAARQLSDNIRAKSPMAIIVLENTWSYSNPRTKDTAPYNEPYLGFGSYENFDKKLTEGCNLLKIVCPNINKISPIGKAFAEYRSLYPDFYPSAKRDTVNSIYRKWGDSHDDHHQSPIGAYLKSCVNYLLIFKEYFEGEVDCCGIEPSKAALLRRIAEDVVLGAKPIQTPSEDSVSSK